MKVDAFNGNIIWATEYGGSATEFIGAYTTNSDGTLVAVGGTKSYGMGGNDFFILKTRSNGYMDSCYQVDIQSQFLVQNFQPNISSTLVSNQTNFSSANTIINVTTPPTIQSSICFVEDVSAVFILVNDTICAEECIQIINSSTNANAYQWTMTGASITTSSNSVPNNICYPNPGTFTIQLIASNGLNADTTTRQIVVQAIPNFNLGNDTAFCDLDSFLFEINLPNVSYLWQDSSTNNSYLATSNGNYGLTITNAEGCSQSDNIQLAFDFTPNLELGNDTIICEGNSVLLNAFSDNATYFWNNGATSSTINVTTTGIYNVDVSIGACLISDTIDIEVLPAPAINLGKDTFICDDVILELETYNDLAISYLWQDGSMHSKFEIIEAGTYFVEIEYISGCTNFDTIVIFAEPSIDISLPEDTTFCKGNPIILNAYHPNARSYEWKGLSAYYGQNDLNDTTFIVSLEGIYSVILNNGCRDFEYELSILSEDCTCQPFAPNAFSPNGDGNNDNLKIYTNCEISEFKILVFDRWGSKVFETNDLNLAWNGLINGKEAPVGVYVWMIEYVGNNQSGESTSNLISGDVTLMR